MEYVFIVLQALNYKNMYKITQNNNCILLIEKNSFIPFDPANTDYQAYLKWLSEGNTPLPPDDQEG
jgi:hypothetical protein